MSAAPSLWEQGTPETASHRAAAVPGGLLGCLCRGCPSRLHPGRTLGHVQEGGLSFELPASSPLCAGAGEASQASELGELAPIS